MWFFVKLFFKNDLKGLAKLSKMVYNKATNNGGRL